MNAMECLLKIAPKTVDKFVGNKQVIRNVRDFLNSMSEKNVLCIMGPDGCGKSTLSKLLLDKGQYMVFDVSRESLNGQDTKAMLLAFANNNTIDCYIKKKTKVIFVDDLDILTNIDKMFLSKLLAINTKLTEKGIKVLMTTNTRDEKKLNEHTKSIDVVKLYYPPIKDAYVHIMMSFDEVSVEYNAEELLQVVTKCKGNIRQSVLCMNSTNNELQVMSDETAFKDMNSFEMCKRVLSKRYTKNELDILAYGDSGTLTYIVYENMPDEFDANYKVGSSGSSGSNGLIKKYLHMNKAFIDGCAFEEKAFQSVNWSLLTYANLLKLGTVHTILQSSDAKATRKDVKYRFSQLLSKTSHKNIMAKKVRAISSLANISNKAVINATDYRVRKASKTPKASKASTDTKKTKKNKTTSIQDLCTALEENCVINTYEKYFGE